MANTEVLNMQGLKDKITEKVKTSFFELLPDDKFQELVDKEIQDFFSATTEQFSIANIDSSWNSTSYFLKTPISPFRAIVWNQCQAMVASKLQHIFSDQGFYSIMNSMYGTQNNLMETSKLSDALKELLKAQANELASHFFENMFAQAFNSVTPTLIETMRNSIATRY